MPRLIWSSAALHNVARLRTFFVPKNPDAAKRAAATIRQGVKLLGDHPEVGRPFKGMAPKFREWSVGFGSGSYLVLYHFDGKEVTILAVRHGRELGY